MHPQHWWWLFAVKMPRETGLSEDDKAELYEMLE
jgi:hypothetical protein